MDNQIYRATEMYRSPYPYPIHFRQGEMVEIGELYAGDAEWPDWLWCTGEVDQSAWTPTQYLQINGKTGIMKRDYDALELSVEQGETLIVIEVINGFALAEKTDGKIGWVPLKMLTPEQNQPESALHR